MGISRVPILIWICGLSIASPGCVRPFLQEVGSALGSGMGDVMDEAFQRYEKVLNDNELRAVARQRQIDELGYIQAQLSVLKDRASEHEVDLNGTAEKVSSIVRQLPKVWERFTANENRAQEKLDREQTARTADFVKVRGELLELRNARVDDMSVLRSELQQSRRDIITLFTSVIGAITLLVGIYQASRAGMSRPSRSKATK